MPELTAPVGLEAHWPGRPYPTWKEVAVDTARPKFMLMSNDRRLLVQWLRALCAARRLVVGWQDRVTADRALGSLVDAALVQQGDPVNADQRSYLEYSPRRHRHVLP